MAYLSLSTWSLHRLLGPLRWTFWDADEARHIVHEQHQPQILTLLQLPAEAAKRGYSAVEICHFHFPSVEPDYLAGLREAFHASGVRFDTLLLDYGDLTATDPIRLAADLALMHAWIDAAASAGAKQIRIVAGERDASDETALAQSARHLRELSAYANEKNVNVVTENFKALTATGDRCRELSTLTEPDVQWITDFGNFSGPRKYEELDTILNHSVSVHAKAHYDDQGLPDRPEFERCLDRSIRSGFDGAYVLIYDGPGDMWEGLERIKTIVQEKVKDAQ